MKIKNIWKDVQEPLEMHTDNRGSIVDIFYNDNIQHVAYIKSNKGALRGNHYHKETTQYVMVTKGVMKYWYKPLDNSDISRFVLVRSGDLLETPPNEIHAMEFPEEYTEFIVFTEGTRGGKDYESDTFRTESIIC